MREPTKPDFIPLAELCALTGVAIQTAYQARWRRRGPLSEILTKLGHWVGAWRPDYEAWVASQRRLPDAPVAEASKQAAA